MSESGSATKPPPSNKDVVMSEPAKEAPPLPSETDNIPEIEEDDFRHEWEEMVDYQHGKIYRFYNGRCLTCYPYECNCYEGKCPREEKRETQRGYPMMTFPMGNCRCGSAGTVGYKCKFCKQGRYQKTYYPPREDNQFVEVDWYHWAEANYGSICAINPPADIIHVNDSDAQYLSPHEVIKLLRHEINYTKHNMTDFDMHMYRQVYDWVVERVPIIPIPFQRNELNEWVNAFDNRNMTQEARRDYKIQSPTRQYLVRDRSDEDTTPLWKRSSSSQP